MKEVLVIHHVEAGNNDNGGMVYVSSILEILKANLPNVRFKDLYCNNAYRKGKKLFEFVSFLFSIFSKESAKEIYYYSEKVKKQLLCVDWGNVQCVVFTHSAALWAMKYIPDDIYKITIEQNLEFILHECKYAKYEDTPILGGLVKADVQKSRGYEITGLNNSDIILTISTDDETELQKIIDTPVLTIPPTFSYERLDYKNNRDYLVIGFVGNVLWWPNAEGIEWFIDEIFQNIDLPNIEFHIYGKGTQKYHSNSKKIYGHGFVRDISDIWGNIDILINPILSGGGVNVKVAEGLYNSIPMICTKKALRGISICESNSIVVLDEDPDKWLEYLNIRNLTMLADSEFNPDNSEVFNQECYIDKLRGKVTS